MAENDYSGYILTMESFTAQTTDGSGDIVVTLQNTPAADDSIIVNLQGVAGAFAQFKSRTDDAVTFTVFQKYDKTDTTGGGTVTDLPTGVTADTTTNGPSFTSGGPSATQVDKGSTSGTYYLPHETHTHSTRIGKISNHNHTATGTALTALATTGSITLVVTYAYS